MDKLEGIFWVCAGFILTDTGYKLYKYNTLDTQSVFTTAVISFCAGQIIGKKLN